VYQLEDISDTKTGAVYENVLDSERRMANLTFRPWKKLRKISSKPVH